MEQVSWLQKLLMFGQCFLFIRGLSKYKHHAIMIYMALIIKSRVAVSGKSIIRSQERFEPRSFRCLRVDLQSRQVEANPNLFLPPRHLSLLLSSSPSCIVVLLLFVSFVPLKLSQPRDPTPTTQHTEERKAAKDRRRREEEERTREHEHTERIAYKC